MGVEIKCPFCGGRASIRTSERPSLLTVKASVFCPNCNQLKGEFVGQLTNVKRAVFIDCPEVNRWEKSEKEMLKEQGKSAPTNEERLAKLKQDASGQKWLFAEEKPQREISPLERQAKRQALHLQ